MKKILTRFGILSLLIASLLIAGCGTTAEITSAWVEPNLDVKHLNGVLVIAVAKKEEDRIDFETAYVKSLKRKGVHAVASSTLLPGRPDKEQLITAAKDAKLEAILLTRYTGTVEEPVYFKGRDYYVRTPSYDGGYYPGRFGGYYGHATKIYSQPDIWMTNKYITLVSDLYKTSDEQHLWQATSSALEPDNKKELRDAFIDAFIDQMLLQKLIK